MYVKGNSNDTIDRNILTYCAFLILVNIAFGWTYVEKLKEPRYNPCILELNFTSLLYPSEAKVV